MNILILNLIIDALLGIIVIIRIHHGGIFEIGAMLRLSVLLLAVWRGFLDLHAYYEWIDYGVLTDVPDPTRITISGSILLTGVLLDTLRDYQRHHSRKKVQELVEIGKNGK